MTEQPYHTNPKIPAVESQSLNFQQIVDNACGTVYEALIVNGDAVLALTVSFAAQVQRESGKQVTELLSRMKAGFELLSKPPVDGSSEPDDPKDGEPGLEEPLDPSKHVAIEFRLASFTGPEPAGIIVTVESTTGIVPSPDQSDAGGGASVQLATPGQVTAGLSDVYQSNNHSKHHLVSFTAYVTAGISGGRLSSAGQTSKALYANSQRSMTGVTVSVTAPPKRAMNYTFTGSGHIIVDN